MKETKIGKYATVKCDTTGLDNLIKASEERYVVRVGILGNKAQAKHQRKETGDLRKRGGGHKTGQGFSDQSNADIGLLHEKGSKSKSIPRRSWLLTPLEDHLPEHFEKLGKEAVELILIHPRKENYDQLGVVCEQIIQKGFETAGYGKWQALKQVTIDAKHSSAILIDTGQLRKSITHDVVTA